jgi:poly(glycerol-phosphate) alpha-glucosyltransferase
MPIDHLPMREMDFCAPDFPAKAMAMANGFRRTVFHLSGITRPNINLAAQLKKSGMPYVFTSHGQLNCHGPANWLKKFVYLNLISPFVRNASGLHFLTRVEARRCKFLLPGWRKVVFVHGNLAKIPAPALISPWSREQLGFPPQAFVFAYLGRLDVTTKGLDYLMKAFAKVAAEKDCFLILVGPDQGGSRRFLELLAGRLNCEKRIRFLGPQYGNDKWRALRLADAFVSPSRWDNFGISQVEAIGFGVPTLVSTKMNIASELVDSQAALAAPLSAGALADGMRQLMGDTGLRRSLSECGRRWAVKNCSITTAGARFEEFYLKVLGWTC